MKIPVIRQLVEKYSIAQLEEAENNIIEERPHSIKYAGDDAGDQLTNIMGALWVKREMEQSGCDLKTAVRAYSQKVRDSIS